VDHLAESGHGVVFDKCTQRLGLDAALPHAQTYHNLQMVACEHE
jgi:hypothetical protein